MKNSKLMIRKNRHMIISSVELIVLGVYFFARPFRFQPLFWLDTALKYVGTSETSIFTIMIGLFCLIVVSSNIEHMFPLIYGIELFVFLVYMCAFIASDIDAGEPVIGPLSMGTIYTSSCVLRVVVESKWGHEFND